MDLRGGVKMDDDELREKYFDSMMEALDKQIVEIAAGSSGHVG